MRTNCVPIAAELFLYSYEDGLTQKLTTDKVIQKLRPLISLSGLLVMFCQLIIHFDDWIPSIHNKELKIKETT
jgi:hypothetical protein